MKLKTTIGLFTITLLIAVFSALIGSSHQILAEGGCPSGQHNQCHDEVMHNRFCDQVPGSCATVSRCECVGTASPPPPAATSAPAAPAATAAPQQPGSNCRNCGGGSCPDGSTYGADSCAPQATCAQRTAEACASHQAPAAAAQQQGSSGGNKCDGWADSGSTQRNSGNGCMYTCNNGSWGAAHECDGLGNGLFGGAAPTTDAERAAQATAVAQRQAEAEAVLATQTVAQTQALATQRAAQIVNETQTMLQMAQAQGNQAAIARQQQIAAQSQAILDQQQGTKTVPGQTASTTPVADTTAISDAAKNIMDGLASHNVNGVVSGGCNIVLGLCPMIDPKTGVTNGWVPSDKPVFGTFEQAMQARQNVSIGNLFKDKVTLVDGSTVEKVYNFNWQNEKPEDLGMNIKDAAVIAQIKEITDKNKIKVGDNGVVQANDKGDLLLQSGDGVLSREVFVANRDAFTQDQNKKIDTIKSSIVDNNGNYTEAAKKALTECAKDVNCNADKLAKNVGGLDLLPANIAQSITASLTQNLQSVKAEIAAQVAAAQQAAQVAAAQQVVAAKAAAAQQAASQEELNKKVAAFSQADNPDKLAAAACSFQGIKSGDRFDDCVAREKAIIQTDPSKSYLLKNVDPKSIAPIVKGKTDLFTVLVKSQSAATAFQGVQPSDFINLDALIAEKKKALCPNAGGSAQSCPFTREDLISRIIVDKQNTVYIKSCNELSGGAACQSSTSSKQFLLKAANPDISQTQLDNLTTNLRPELGTATTIITNDKVKNTQVATEVSNTAGQLLGRVGDVVSNYGTFVSNNLVGIGRLAVNIPQGKLVIQPGEFQYVDVLRPTEAVNQQQVLQQTTASVEKSLLTSSQGVLYNVEQDARYRMETKLGNLSSAQLSAAENRVAAGETWQKVEQDYKAGVESQGAAGLAVAGWNDFTAGRFKRGNDTYIQGLENRDVGQTIRGALTQGGDAAAVVVAVAAAPIAIYAAPALGLGTIGTGAIIQTGVLGVAVSTQMLGQAADTCEQANQGRATQSQCLTSTALFVTSAVGTSLGVAKSAGQAVQVAEKAAAARQAAGEAVTISGVAPKALIVGETATTKLLTAGAAESANTGVALLESGASTSLAPVVNATEKALVTAGSQVAETGLTQVGNTALSPFTQAVGTAANSAGGQLAMNAAEATSKGLGFVTFSEMAADSCKSDAGIHCAATALMALASGTGIVSGVVEDVAGSASKSTLTNIVGKGSSLVENASKVAFVGSACSGLVNSGATLDAASMCAMSLHGALEMAHPVEVVTSTSRELAVTDKTVVDNNRAIVSTNGEPVSSTTNVDPNSTLGRALRLAADRQQAFNTQQAEYNRLIEIQKAGILSRTDADSLQRIQAIANERDAAQAVVNRLSLSTTANTTPNSIAATEVSNNVQANALGGTATTDQTQREITTLQSGIDTQTKQLDQINNSPNAAARKAEADVLVAALYEKGKQLQQLQDLLAQAPKALPAPAETTQVTKPVLTDQVVIGRPPRNANDIPYQVEGGESLPRVNLESSGSIAATSGQVVVGRSGENIVITDIVNGGTKVNGKNIERNVPHNLAIGDTVTIGGVDNFTVTSINGRLSLVHENKFIDIFGQPDLVKAGVTRLPGEADVALTARFSDIVSLKEKGVMVGNIPSSEATNLLASTKTIESANISMTLGMTPAKLVELADLAAFAKEWGFAPKTGVANSPQNITRLEAQRALVQVAAGKGYPRLPNEISTDFISRTNKLTDIGVQRLTNEGDQQFTQRSSDILSLNNRGVSVGNISSAEATSLRSFADIIEQSGIKMSPGINTPPEQLARLAEVASFAKDWGIINPNKPTLNSSGALGIIEYQMTQIQDGLAMGLTRQPNEKPRDFIARAKAEAQRLAQVKINEAQAQRTAESETAKLKAEAAARLKAEEIRVAQETAKLKADAQRKAQADETARQEEIRAQTEYQRQAEAKAAQAQAEAKAKQKNNPDKFVFGREDTKSGQTASVNGETLPRNQVDTSDNSVSRNHIVVDRSNGKLVIEDISSNGTAVNGKRITKNNPTELKLNDLVQLGNQGSVYKVISVDGKLTLAELGTTADVFSTTTKPAQPTSSTANNPQQNSKQSVFRDASGNLKWEDVLSAGAKLNSQINGLQDRLTVLEYQIRSSAQVVFGGSNVREADYRSIFNPTRKYVDSLSMSDVINIFKTHSQYTPRDGSLTSDMARLNVLEDDYNSTTLDRILSFGKIKSQDAALNEMRTILLDMQNRNLHEIASGIAIRNVELNQKSAQQLRDQMNGLQAEYDKSIAPFEDEALLLRDQINIINEARQDSIDKSNARIAKIQGTIDAWNFQIAEAKAAQARAATRGGARLTDREKDMILRIPNWENEMLASQGNIDRIQADSNLRAEQAVAEAIAALKSKVQFPNSTE